MYVVIDGCKYVTAIKSNVILIKKKKQTQLFLASKSVG